VKAKEFSESKIIKILEEADNGNETVPELARRHGISQWTFYRWRRKYGGMSVSQAARLKELERENARLKKLVVDRDLELEVMKEIAAKKW
jgi:putative transposase